MSYPSLQHPSGSLFDQTGKHEGVWIGSETLKRLDYTVIGDSVNLAQRLQTAAHAGQIVISEDVCQNAKESFSCEKIGEVKLKNKLHPVIIYQVLE